MAISQYAVFGNPIEHSFSPLIHRRFAEQTAEPIQYHRELIAIDDLETAVRQFFLAGGAGLNITVPFKLRACAMAESLSPRAQKAGAVNTLQIKNNKLHGDNTDGEGLCRDICDNLGWTIKNKTILLIGAGGAVRGVLQPLLSQTPRQLVIVNRTVEKAMQLTQLFADQAKAASCPLKAVSFDQLAGQKVKFDLIINGSSSSLNNELPALPPAVVNHASCYDMMYAKTPTAFLQWAAKHGASSVADGLGMLVEQAAEAFYLWRGVRPNTTAVIKELRAQL